MNKDIYEKQMKREKRCKIITISISIFFIVTVLAVFGVYKYNHTFTPQRWSTDLENRYKMVSDMLRKNEIIGMSESDITELLGQEDSEQSSFKIRGSREVFSPESTLVYYLGVDFMDNNWLVVSIENGVAVSYCIDVT
ncbi:MAG: hypothetical protein Q4B48_08695 [Syntrophomonadaceae bacterium]|nr:hypothetical protein [Syntrophomonadaceae bacterium]